MLAITLNLQNRNQKIEFCILNRKICGARVKYSTNHRIRYFIEYTDEMRNLTLYLQKVINLHLQEQLMRF